MLSVPPSAAITDERFKDEKAHKKLHNCQHSSPLSRVGSILEVDLANIR